MAPPPRKNFSLLAIFFSLHDQRQAVNSFAGNKKTFDSPLANYFSPAI